MARFRYRMQNILNIKEKMEEQEKQNFAVMRGRLNEEEEKLEALREKQREIIEYGIKIRNDVIDVLKIKENTAQKEYIDGEIRSQVMRVKAAEKNLELARAKMQTAIQERKIHEKLRENAFDQFIKEENLAEAKEIDELTSFTYGRKDDE